MNYNIPLFDLSYNNRKIRDHIIAVVERHIETSTFILGPDVELFEDKFSKLINCKYSIGVNSGTDALIIALKALDIGPGDEVITVPNSYVATAQAISLVGAKPVFVDVDSYTMNMDLKKVQNEINSNTKAIIPVHLFGFPVDIFKLRKIVGDSINIVEDCAQSHGAKVGEHLTGSMGDVNCFSLHPAKVLASLGDSGVITTNDKKIYRRCRLFRNFGLKDRDSTILIGYNSRLDNIYAAIMYKKLDIIQKSLKRRLKNASIYYNELNLISDLVLPPKIKGYKNIHNFFVIRTDRRDELSDYLSSKGIETKIHYPIPIHLQECYHDLGYKKGDFPNVESDASTMLTIPVAEHLEESQIFSVSKEIKSFF
ncbi:MAG: DegT/DnrJ/EryC1/StrS family aminotransferase [SAR202 cluster bacterium]|jgi:dTDP-4-amino-4,6-dideoxygalactose transaminase|nr:DegT/DnrJ/EryC1/StrS family aminotransferase [SAR202 cluster bacterium]|tara:strand:+ start:283 stop:1386 length:1104 start_codon:yes stop_codon:yes gene_type:complete